MLSSKIHIRVINTVSKLTGRQRNECEGDEKQTRAKVGRTPEITAYTRVNNTLWS